jgi:hypothetical protein
MEAMCSSETPEDSTVHYSKSLRIFFMNPSALLLPPVYLRAVPDEDNVKFSIRATELSQPVEAERKQKVLHSVFKIPAIRITSISKKKAQCLRSIDFVF